MSTILEKKSVDKLVPLIAKVLASTYLVYIKTQNFHWNVIDGRFHSLHEFFKEQYKELAEAIDEIAERIRMLGRKSPGSMREFLDLSDLDESTEELSADEMLAELLDDHLVIIQQLRQYIQQCQERGDEGTADLFIARLRAHEKTAWMLRSHL